MERYEIDEQDRALIAEAMNVIRRSYDAERYLHTVGCAIRSSGGKVFRGVNCDGIHGSCAEFVTMGTAVSAGAREFDTIVAVHEGHPNGVIAPCGNCRQMLFEYCPDILVIVNDESNHLIKVRARDLLPLASD